MVLQISSTELMEPRVEITFFGLGVCILSHELPSLNGFVFSLSPENGQVYVQKKPTMYPPWNSTFDAHINNGRVMHIVVKDKSAEMVSETTVELKVLAERCKKSNGKTEIWVSITLFSCRMCWGKGMCPCVRARLWLSPAAQQGLAGIMF